MLREIIFCIILAICCQTVDADRPKPLFKVLYNHDTTNILNCTSPWRHHHKNGDLFQESQAPGDTSILDKYLAESIKEAEDVDVILLAPGLGWIPWWQSKVYPDHYQWWQNWTGLDLDEFGNYVLSGGDLIKTFVSVCRQLGISPFVTFRINDVHMQEYVGKRHPRSIWVSRFYTENLEYMLDPAHLKRKDYCDTRGQDWSIPEVRNYKFRLMKEVIESYDLDGFEIDFLRERRLFNTNNTTKEQRVEIITDYIEKIRCIMDEKKQVSGKRMWFSVRIPGGADYYGDMGIDIKKMYDAGVDMFILSDSYFTKCNNDMARVRQLVPHAAIYHEMTHTSGALFFLGKDQPYGTASFPRTSDHQFYTAAHMAYSRGADGISFFNFVYYRDHGTSAIAPISEPPFHVLKHVREPQWLSRQSQYYWLGRCAFMRQMPRSFNESARETFTLDMAPPLNGWASNGRLRIHTKDPIPKHAVIDVLFNGKPLKISSDITAFYDNPYDIMLSDSERRMTWIVPFNYVKNGLNELKMTLSGTENLVVEYLDLAI